jgi:hypothetical protein
MKSITGGITLALVLAAAQIAAAQQPGDARTDDLGAKVEQIVERSGITEALETLAVATAPELERTLGQLARTLEALGNRVANDPQLRASALTVAHGMVEVAQVVLVEQTKVLDEALRVAAERLAEVRVPEGI